MSGAEIYLNWFYHFCTVNAETSVFENSSSGAPKMIFFSFLFSPLELKHPFFSLSLSQLTRPFKYRAKPNDTSDLSKTNIFFPLLLSVN